RSAATLRAHVLDLTPESAPVPARLRCRPVAYQRDGAATSGRVHEDRRLRRRRSTRDDPFHLGTCPRVGRDVSNGAFRTACRSIPSPLPALDAPAPEVVASLTSNVLAGCANRRSTMAVDVSSETLRRTARRVRIDIVWLAAAAVTLLLANGRWIVPACAWIAPACLLRFLRGQHARVRLAVLFVLLCGTTAATW